MTERKNRTVHAAWPGVEVVRYGKQGKWYLERDGEKTLPISLEQAANAARFALSNGGEVFRGLPGGKTFEAKLDSR